MKKQLSDLTLIIDGNNLAHRCRHVFNLSNKGKDVSVTYGFLRVLESYMKKFKPSSIIVCWDGGVPEFRKEAVPEYKANRNHSDEMDYADFLRQVYELHNFAFPIMGIISIRHMGAEADDLCYHASRMIKGSNTVISGDRDLYQCINGNTVVYNPGKEKIVDARYVEKEFGIPLSSYVHWKAIQGDSSDNIPGVPGIGEKTATKLFQEYGELTRITNTALGISPHTSPMSASISAKINAFGFNRIVKNIFVMALYKDRVGARWAIHNAIQNQTPLIGPAVKHYLMKNGFVSLLSGDFMSGLTNLKPPKYIEKVRICICRPNHRTPFLEKE